MFWPWKQLVTSKSWYRILAVDISYFTFFFLMEKYWKDGLERHLPEENIFRSLNILSHYKRKTLKINKKWNEYSSKLLVKKLSTTIPNSRFNWSRIHGYLSTEILEKQLLVNEISNTAFVWSGDYMSWNVVFLKLD